jgi:hypothetical protein
MGERCTVCTHPEADALNVALGSGTAAAKVAREYGVSVDSLKRHRAGHLTPAMVRVAVKRRNEAGAVSAVERLESLYGQAQALLNMAETKGSLMAGGNIIGQLRGIIETMARLSGELDERPSITVNLMSSPEVIELLSRLMGALAPFPDARVAVANAIDVEALEVGA